MYTRLVIAPTTTRVRGRGGLERPSDGGPLPVDQGDWQHAVACALLSAVSDAARIERALAAAALSAAVACCLTHSSPARCPTEPMSRRRAGLPLGNRVST
eukprot:10267068-Alexandrium_andersonii.AAC.1